MCPVSECICCPVNKNCCNYPMISLMTAKEWLAVLSPPTVPLQQLILYIKRCKHMTMGTPRLEGDLLSQHVPRHCFCIIGASILVWFFFFFVLFLHEVALMSGFRYCTMLLQLFVGLWWQLSEVSCLRIHAECVYLHVYILKSLHAAET